MSSLPDTEPAEDHPQQLIGRNGTSDPPQRLMGQSQFLGKEIEGLVSQRHVVAGVLQVLQCFGKCLQVALAGDEDAFLARLKAGNVEQFLAEGVDALAGFGGKTQGFALRRRGCITFRRVT